MGGTHTWRIKTANQDAGRDEESDEAVVPRNAMNVAGGKGLYLTRRPL